MIKSSNKYVVNIEVVPVKSHVWYDAATNTNNASDN